ncbi:hypothetical protein [Actinopolymorpha pittospori]|uniref:Carboxypeptidase regulatory-like domain-containing protein n=1 Tax=Actinopolymorpha pittospori TaxID=648752 RepID=A0A927RGT5_9ACTN|nr:hypothetical protein [Actinopolymorpha pittospori]MBE1604516.1 hypothetical protein [Actinopolymorpha pittospori]
MNEHDRSSLRRSADPHDDLDATDAAILRGLRRVVTAADPVPAGLVERIRFALALEDLEAEMMRLQEEPALAGVRTAEQATRTVTFESETFTIMISIRSSGEGAVRLDGWIAPAAAHRVELRLVGDRRVVMADEQGRFAYDDVPRGLLQMAVYNASGRPKSVVTPSIVV